MVPQWVWRIGCGGDEVVANATRRLVTADSKLTVLRALYTSDSCRYLCFGPNKQLAT